MAWSNDWGQNWPRRQLWSNTNQTCWEDSLSFWGYRSGDPNRDRYGNPGVCGVETWHSANNARGDGNTVLVIQQRVNRAWRYYKAHPAWIDGVSGMPDAPIVEDGVYGSKTGAMIRWFQRRNGMDYDGLTGRDTWNKLLGW